jgi:hypothetical protein
MRDFWAAISSVDSEAVVRRIERNERFMSWRAFFRERWRSYLNALEMRAGEEVLRRHTEARSSVLAAEGYAGVDCELQLVGDAALQLVIVVGCGPYPETLLAISESALTIHRVVGLDRSPQAVRIAGEVIKRCRAAKQHLPRVRAECAPAAEASYQAADVVLLANGVEGKRAVLHRIAATAPPGVRVLARNPVLLGRLLYEDVFEGGVQPEWRTVSVVRPTALSETYLLERVVEPR